MKTLRYPLLAIIVAGVVVPDTPDIPDVPIPDVPDIPVDPDMPIVDDDGDISCPVDMDFVGQNPCEPSTWVGIPENVSSSEATDAL